MAAEGAGGGRAGKKARVVAADDTDSESDGDHMHHDDGEDEKVGPPRALTATPPRTARHSS